jgi:hypothetical protein
MYLNKYSLEKCWSQLTIDSDRITDLHVKIHLQANLLDKVVLLNLEGEPVETDFRQQLKIPMNQ